MTKTIEVSDKLHRDLEDAQARFTMTIDQIERLQGRPRVAATLALCLSLETAIRGVVDTIRDLYDSMYDE